MPNSVDKMLRNPFDGRLPGVCLPAAAAGAPPRIAGVRPDGSWQTLPAIWEALPRPACRAYAECILFPSPKHGMIGEKEFRAEE